MSQSATTSSPYVDLAQYRASATATRPGAGADPATVPSLPFRRPRSSAGRLSVPVAEAAVVTVRWDSGRPSVVPTSV